MIPIERIPKSGQLIIAVNFKDYDEYYANETRKTLNNLPNRKDIKAVGIELYPLDYWLKRTVINKGDVDENDDSKKVERRTRATGGLYRVGFMNMTSDKFIELSKLLKNMKKTYWEEVELLIADQVEGV